MQSRTLAGLISIPSGTIKSLEMATLLFQEQISIPSGTIKSVTISPSTSVLPSISIPSGTIKRVVGNASSYSVSLFQFLLVRLKVLFGNAIIILFYYFNSFWYD